LSSNAPPLSRTLVAPRASFVVADATGQAVAYTYFRKDENEARQAQVLTYDEARRIAANIAKLPEMLSHKGEE
jgi:hypothetical protein